MAIIHIKLTAEQSMSKSRLWGKTSKTMEVLYGSFMAVFGVLLRLGFFPQHAGFGYLACAISSIAANPMNYYGHGSDIFGILESEYGISRAKATRCMRYSIAIAWQSQENKEFHALFKSYGDEFPPPVSEFIFRSAFEIRSAQIRESETDNSISPVLRPWNCNSKRVFRAAHRPDDKQGKHKCHGNRKQPDNDSFCGKQAFAALFCKGIVRQATKQMHSLFAKNGSLHSPEQPMPVLLCGYFAFPQFWRPWCSEQSLFLKEKLTDSLSNIFNSLPAIFCTAEVLNLLLLRKLQLHSITAIRKLKCTNPLKNNPLSTRSQRLRHAKYSQCHRFCSSRSPMPFLNPNPLSQKTANSAGFKTGRNAAIT